MKAHVNANFRDNLGAGNAANRPEAMQRVCAGLPIASGVTMLAKEAGAGVPPAVWIRSRLMEAEVHPDPEALIAAADRSDGLPAPSGTP